MDHWDRIVADFRRVAFWCRFTASVVRDPDNTRPILELLAGIILFILALRVIVASVTP